MNTLFSGFFITLGLGIGSVISSLSAAAGNGIDDSADRAGVPEVAASVMPPLPRVPRSEPQALGIMLALSHHERAVAKAIDGTRNAQLQSTVARHMEQHQRHMHEFETLTVDLDSDATRDLWLAATNEETVIGLQDEAHRDGAYLQAALKCNQQALAVIDQQVMPAITSEQALRMVRQSRQDTLQRITDLKSLLATDEQPAAPDIGAPPAEARTVQAP